MKHRFALILVLATSLIFGPTVKAQEAVQQSEAKNPSTADFGREPNGSIVTLQGFMGEIRALTKSHLELMKETARQNKEHLDQRIAQWEKIGGFFMALLALIGGGAVWSLFKYARSQAKNKADRVIDEELHRHTSAATILMKKEFEKWEDELKKRMGEAVAKLDANFAKIIAKKEAELKENLEEQTVEISAAMYELQDDVDQLRESKGPRLSDSSKPTVDEPEDREASWQNIKFTLLNHKYVWRTIQHLARGVDMKPERTEEILKEHRDEVKISRGKSGRTIVRHLTRSPRDI